MKVSLRWLREYVDLPDDAESVARALVALGHEVEDVETVTADWSGVTIARVLEVAPHPDADKVRLCQVTVGGDPIPVVCGAWNFEAGAVVAWAEPGAVLPGDFRIGVRTIRGVESNGMICSERELGLGDDHDGIIVLDDDAPVGTPFAEWVELPDTIIDVTITPNRPDAMSLAGLARDLAAHFDTGLRIPAPEPTTVAGTVGTRVVIDDAEGCPRFVLRQIDGVHIGRAPYRMRRRLAASGVRPISNLVDVTNYVMLELGQPLHVFDADRVNGDFTVRRADDAETMETLDGTTRRLDPTDIVIVDADGPTSLAGTMGGLRSEVVDTTSRVLIEAAAWHPPSIMRTSRRHNLRSEASARFERGVDPNLPPLAATRAAELMLATGGGSLVDEVVDVIARPIEPAVISLGVDYVARTLGPGFDSAHIAELLGSIGFGVTGTDPLEVTVPTVRPDVVRPIDLVEEVARLHGYERFPETVPAGPGGGWSPEQRRAMQLRTVLAGAGLHQAVNLSFLAAEDLDAFAYPADHDGRAVVRVVNPLRDEESAMRTAVLPGLLRSIRHNRSHGRPDVALFETGKVFFARPDATDPRIPAQPDRVAWAVTGGYGATELGAEARPADIHTATALLRLVAERLGLDVALEAATEPGFHPGRCARVSIGDRTVGYVGEIHPRTAAAYDIDTRVAAAELDLAALTAAVDHRLLAAPSPYPQVDFDLAFVVPDAVPAADVVGAMHQAGGALVEHLAPFDEYRGVGDGQRSLAVRVRLRSHDKTFTNEEAAAVRAAMIEAVAGLGGALRGVA